jgi:epoxyqueuosine reductase
MHRPEITAEIVKEKARSLGFDRVGIAAAVAGEETERLQAWLAMGYHADMAWMQSPKRQDISLCLPGVKSVICVAINYYTNAEHSKDRDHAKISRYGWGRDYHRVLGKRLKALSMWLESLGNGITTRYYVDTGPIAEKAWAQRAGIGWIGKHSNLISRDYGSWLFLGEVLTNLELEIDRPHAQHCGSCTRCIEACPTEAIVQPFVVDANRCIAYHTIENRAAQIPLPVAANLNNWVAGCDICQDVCPWNQSFAQETAIADFHPYPHNIAPKLAELAEITEPGWSKNLTGSALRRIKPSQWRRNAQTAIDTNKKHSDCE